MIFFCRCCCCCRIATANDAIIVLQWRKLTESTCNLTTVPSIGFQSSEDPLQPSRKYPFSVIILYETISCNLVTWGKISDFQYS